MIDPIRKVDVILKQYFPNSHKQHTMYSNHVHRVFELCILQDDTAANRTKYAIAAAFHDLGIWSHNTFNYINPSILELKKYLEREGQMDLYEELSIMIKMHHKRSTYEGVYAESVETFRRADWMDVSVGYKNFGIDKERYQSLKKAFPYEGFHFFLVKQTIKNFIKHPSNPLPMFRK